MELKYKSRLQKYEIIEVDGEEILKETAEWSQFKSEKMLFHKAKKSSIPEHALGLTLDDLINLKDIQRKLTKYIDEFETKYKSIHLYLWSKQNGTQKTTAASIIAKDLILKGYSVEFILMSTLSKMLTKESWEDEADSQIKKLESCDFLVIDDSFDPKKITLYKSGYQVPFLDTFLRNRLETKRKATCFTSNVALNRLDEEAFGTSLVKLIQRSIIDPFEFTIPYSKRNDFNPNDLWS